MLLYIKLNSINYWLWLPKFIFKTILFKFTIQCCPAYAEQFGGKTSVVVCLLQRTQYPLLILHIIAQCETDGGGRFRHGKFQMFFRYNTFLSLQYNTPYLLPKLAHVARSCVGYNALRASELNPLTLHSNSLLAIPRKNSVSGIMPS